MSKIIKGRTRFAAGIISLFLLSVLLFLNANFSPVSASPEPLRWLKVNTPADGEVGNWVLARGSDIKHLAPASDGTLYASVQGLTNTLYRSTDGGLSWASIGNVRDTIIDISVSPRDAKKIYYATTSAVYRSTNGGKTFTALPTPGGAGAGHREITSLDVTSLNESIIAIATKHTDSAEYGGVFLWDESNLIPAWIDTSIGSYDVYALAFSPNYTSDRQLIAVTTNETDTFIASKIDDSAWNAVTERARLNRDNAHPTAPVALTSSATIAFPRNYRANQAIEINTFFVSIDTGTGLGDVYKIDCPDSPDISTATDLNVGQSYGFANIDITGFTATGNYPATVLIAGESRSAKTYTSIDGGRNWTRSRKEPSGDMVTCLLTTPDFANSGQVYAATSGNNSAFSISRDIGATWNQLSLIDTSLDSIIDLAPSPRYSKDNVLFLLTFGGGPSLWRSRNEGNNWERILTGHPGVVDALKFVSLPPRYGNDCQTVFIAGESNAKPAVWQSTDDGQSFRSRPTRDPVTGVAFPIDTWAIIDENSFLIGSYDGSQGIIYLTTNSGFVYNEGTPAGNQYLNSLAISPFFQQDGVILAGNTNGWVYCSTDNNSSYRPLPSYATSPPFSAPVAVSFDPHFDKNHTVYASIGNPNGGIHRFTIPTSQEWSNIDTTLPAGSIINRLAVSNEGKLYAADYMTNGGMERCLYPASTANMVFERVMNYLPEGARLSGLWHYDHLLWSIDTFNVRLLAYYDTLTLPAVSTTPVNRASGLGSLNDHKINNVTIDWETLEGATSYEWQCDYSAEFASVPSSLEGTTTASFVRLPALEPATTYHWRVRASAPVFSPWSEKRTFTTSLDTEAIALEPESPAAGAAAVPVKPTFQWTAITGASAYELLVATNADFDHPVIVKTDKYAIKTNAWQCDVNLDYLTTYYWKVKAISESTSSAWSSTGIFTTEPASTKAQEITPSVQLSSPVNRPETIPTSTPSMLIAPVPIIPSQVPVKPAPISSPPYNITEVPVFSQSINLPAWAIYLMFGLLAIVFLALVIVLAIVLKIRRL